MNGYQNLEAKRSYGKDIKFSNKRGILIWGGKYNTEEAKGTAYNSIMYFLAIEPAKRASCEGLTEEVMYEITKGANQPMINVFSTVIHRSEMDYLIINGGYDLPKKGKFYHFPPNCLSDLHF